MNSIAKYNQVNKQKRYRMQRTWFRN